MLLVLLGSVLLLTAAVRLRGLMRRARTAQASTETAEAPVRSTGADVGQTPDTRAYT
jgi:hypothetical protein